MISNIYTFLAIDDNADNLITIKALLLEAFPKSTIFTATSGEEGLSLARISDPDVILLDILMPGLDGFAVCEALKNDAAHRDIPIVFVTALKSDKNQRIRALEVGAEGFLNKPIDECELAALMKAMIKLKQSQRLQFNERERLEYIIQERTKELCEELEARIKDQAHIIRNKERLESLTKILQYNEAKNLQDFLDYALNQALILLESVFGYIYFYDEETQEFTLNSWSRGVMNECAIKDQKTLYQLKNTGLWGEAVRQRKAIVDNNFAAPHSLKKGYPTGHVALCRFMTIPVFFEKKIVAVAGVANKETDYDDSDALQLTLLMDAVWKTTERIQAETKLRESELKYRTLADTGQALIWTSDTSKKCTYFNAPWLSFTGKSLEQELGDGWVQGIHPNDLQRCLDHYCANFDKREHFSMEYRLKNALGEYRWIQDKGTPRYDSQGTFLGYIGHCLDVTEMYAIQIRLRQSEKMEAIGQLAGGIAHDFNNILAGILGYTDMSLDIAETDSRLHKNLQKIFQASMRAKNLVHQILMFSRQSNPQKIALALRPLVVEVLELLSASIPSSVRIESSLNDDISPILGDANALHETILNLATNAVYAMQQKGVLTIKLNLGEITTPTYGRSGLLSSGVYNILEVSDTGCGMDSATLAKIFNPFFTTKPVGEGTGMGLSVVHGIVKSHGGDIQIDSVPHKGTTFRIFLPVVASIECDTTTTHDTPTVGGTEELIIVDDEKVLSELTHEMLASLGYTVHAFSSSRTALDYFKQEDTHCDLIITDQTMPELTGIELAKEIKKLNPDIPIIVCTGYSTEINPERIALMGINKLLMKPITKNTLAKSIREILDLRKDTHHG